MTNQILKSNGMKTQKAINDIDLMLKITLF